VGPMPGRSDALAGGMGVPRGDAGPAPALEGDSAVVPELLRTSAWPPSRSVRSYAVELLAIGLVYVAVAKIGLALASIHPSASPIWPPTGLALAAVMLRGYRVWPAIFLGAWLANATTAGSVYTSSAIALGNTLECLVGAYLISRWSDGLRTFDSPAGVAKFALIALIVATPISATVGVGSLALAGYADDARIASTWLTWWLGDLAGALVITPAIVLWAKNGSIARERKDLLETGAVIAAAIAVGLLAFSPLIDQTPSRDPLGFLAVLPLMWAALRRGQRDTATVALVLSGFALWGAMAGEGPFARSTLNDSLLLLIMYMISTSVPTLALSADVAVHKQTERTLRAAHTELDRTVQERTSALEETREALHQAQKMEALGQLTGGIAHDFNNVLTVIINSLESVRPATDKDAKTCRRLDRALQAARNGATLVQQMLVFARRGPLQVQAADINRIVGSATAMFRRSCPEAIEVSTELASDLRFATADATQLQTAILNLAVNARDAMPSGGSLTIRTSNMALGAPASLPPGDYVAITIADTGVGMSPDVLARAFEPFFTTKELGKGTGLGLSMVYSTMQQMGGEVGIESRPGEGTTVRLMLPVAAPPPTDVPVNLDSMPTARPPKTDPVSLLYVEDDSLVSLATVDLLEGAGYTVHAAPDGRRALDLLDQHPEIDIMVTDIGLPGMDGHELAAEARRRKPGLKLVFLTGYDRSGTISEPADQRTRHLGKPYLDSELFEALSWLSSAGKTEPARPMTARTSGSVPGRAPGDRG
jgi:signal transduction histidine kinase/ActR/RegA family two-component response regulator